MIRLFFAALTVISGPGMLLADGNVCNCRCESRSYVCDELKSISTAVEVNTDDRRKWNRHYQFVQRLHQGWEDEIGHVLEQRLKKIPVSSRSGQKDKKLYDMILKSQEKQIEFQRKLSDLEASLLVSDARAGKFESDLRKEREIIKRLESESRGRESSTDAEIQILSQNIEFLKGKLKAVETKTLNIETELERESEARNKVKVKVEEMLPSLLNYTGKLNNLQISFEGIGKKLEALEGLGSAQGFQILKEQKAIKKLQSTLTRMQSLGLKAADALSPLLPAEDVERFVKELGALDIENPGEETGMLPFRNVTNEYLLSNNPLDEMSSKIEDLESKIKVLSNSISKVAANIKVLENNYKDALRMQLRTQRPRVNGRNPEIVVPHQRPDSRRPFDSSRDP